LRRFTIIKRVKSVSDQKTKRGDSVTVRFASDNGQSRAVLEGPQGIVHCRSATFKAAVRPDWSTIVS
jgi:hypothetical protein